MNETNRIRIAIQKSGRLSEKSTQLLSRCGLEFVWSKDHLFSRCDNFPLDLMFVRDDDIPGYVFDGVCDLGIVGMNVLEEKLFCKPGNQPEATTVLTKLGFGKCRLSIAVPKDQPYQGAISLEGKRIATSYPGILQKFLDRNNINAAIVTISGSVEIAPTLEIADAICDLVSTGTTLKSNGLKEVEKIFESQSVLIQTGKALSASKQAALTRLKQRLKGVLKAENTKYIMMNAQRENLEKIKAILPGMENPSIINLNNDGSKISIHAVSRENVFWETMEKLKEAGASSILVVPIEKIID